MVTALVLASLLAAPGPGRAAGLGGTQPHVSAEPAAHPPGGVATPRASGATIDAGPPGDPEAERAARDEALRLLGLAISGEPALSAVQRAAEARAAPGAAEAEGWRRRARLAAMLPRLVAEYRHDQRTYHEVGLTSSAEVDFIRASPGDTVSVRLDWSLDGLVFGRQELAAAAAAEAAAARRLSAAERAVRLYHERLRLRVALTAAPPTAGRARAELELELQAVTAQLEALTGLYADGDRSP